ncbi:uncharacterized protein [Nicotiana tomentosiformis]|uniref:uncharacterized protein n=1 Tax=Nicotiana tomentosiformis TaxID=4098 RepID=UPI00388C7F9A
MHRHYTPYQPKANGSVEAENKNINKILRNMIQGSKQWHEKLHFALLRYRMTARTYVGATPYLLVYGTEVVAIGIWDGCPNSFYPSLRPYYDISNNVCEYDRSNEVEDVECTAHIMDMVRQVAEQQDENKKAIQRISAAIMRMKAKAEELAKESELPQEDNFEEEDIVSQSWLEE